MGTASLKNELKRFARAMVTRLPALKDPAYALKRSFRTLLNSPVESDFQAIDLFPHVPNALFLDIGCNQGAALDVFLKRNRDATIFSFEPNPQVFQKVHSRFKSNPRVLLFNFGLGATEGTFQLFVPVYRDYEFDGWGSLSPEFEDSWFAKRIPGYDRKFLQLREVRCEIRRLDSLHLDPYFMKIDVQGSELDVIRGGEATIKRARPVILLESGEQDDAIKQFLGRFGYRLYRYSRGRFIPGERGSPNSFFLTDEKYDAMVFREPQAT
jgi:FkbM family methyltransferase